MSSNQSTVDFIIKQMQYAGDISFRKMFGEYALYCNGKMIGTICDDKLFIKPTTAGKTYIGKVVEESPYPMAKPSFLISAKQYQDTVWLSELVKITFEELPMPKKKPVKKKLKK